MHAYELPRRHSAAEGFFADWVAKARLARRLTEAEAPWPAWSMGECLAVAVILDDEEELRSLSYTRAEAIERLRYDLCLDTAQAEEAFRRMRLAVDQATPARAEEG